ncbi:hypothetical protein Egran_04779 [Elaphomyces granulatus]|uniref:Filamentation protein n=1 Tax=Elaphomyces granulatus TaxID=519963 RepID=A0A232LTW1_9EURO|nr:hypothetical protein Egran_04779 [Elaphomyces granulatus]
MSARETEKALRYITALDSARSEDRWVEVPELIRKVTKHAPHRKCLIQTANAECLIVAHISNKRSSTSLSTESGHQSSNLSDLIPLLLSVIEEAEGLPQDVFQAQACLGWVHWTLSEPGLADLRLPKNFDDGMMSKLSEGEQSLSRWTEVCVVKGCYLKGTSQYLVNGRHHALQTFKAVLPWLTALSQQSLSSPQFLQWSERLLAKAAVLANEEASASDCTASQESAEIALKAFRLWSSHPLVKQKDLLSATQVVGPVEPASQLSTWMSYYNLLSAIVQQGLNYVPPAEGRTRAQLANEIRRVEAICESVLLSEVRFPRANSRSSQVESWVEQVIRNWEVLCGPNWRDEDFGEGGQNAVGKNVLDILYRAATKTYHSHLILRRLFHVHSALAEFELAVRALDSYIEIVLSAKDRAEKSAETGELENDETLLQTVSEGIILLCCFGSYREAEKAKSLIEILDKYIRKYVSLDSDVSDDDEGPPKQERHSHDLDQVAPRVIAMAYRAIGIGLANWSRWTLMNESRDDIRAEAIENLERSVAPKWGEQHNLSTLYALALIYAEGRDLDGAITHAKTALATIASYSAGTSLVLDHARLSHERDLVPLWHLLALLLSAKQEFDIAGRSCEAAFEQFPVAAIASGHSERHSTRHMQQNNEKKQHDSIDSRKDFISNLRGREKERILETRMTQLALIEVLDGPEAALNHSDQLISLFAALFENMDLEVVNGKKVKYEHLVPPKSSAGTVKSLRGSIFGRKKGSRIRERRGDPGSDFGNSSIVPIKEITDDAEGPMIQVTDEDRGISSQHPPTIGRLGTAQRHSSHKLHKRRGSIVDPVRSPSQESKIRVKDGLDSDAASTDVMPLKQPLRRNSEGDPSIEEIGIAVSDTPSSTPSPTVPKPSAKQLPPPVTHNMKHIREPQPASHPKQPPEQDVRLPANYRFESPTRAITAFPVVHAQNHALSILVKVWLLIAGLYRRASLFEDSREACEEAAKQASRFEALVASQESSARAFLERVWGVGKSSEGLWGDVFAERGALSQAQGLPHDALELYEEAITHYPDHPKATVGLANLLLDIWEEKIPAEPPQPSLEADLSNISLGDAPRHTSSFQPTMSTKSSTTTGPTERKQQKKPDDGSMFTKDSPESLNRLAARDRAYFLLSALTKLGSSWDDSEAWFALARAYEAGGQIQKSKDVLWWCVELEDRRPIRHWWNLGTGGYVL